MDHSYSRIIKKKRYYIYENIGKLKNHNQIIDIITIKKCKYTENENGIFLNLNTLDEELIDIIYKMILNTLEYNTIDVDTKEKEIDIIIEEQIEKNEKIIEKENKPFCSDIIFSDEEKEIIEYSKIYNL
jgi:hypothetical protein